ncbi:MAG: hypothetical protein EZS28_003492 [Streblomastix strix]|uniref:Uncharacterized protein n=1 Tax=Streblomastix strix TaxID=222440 RepID=A0A5J4X1D8_9EUKA|nr:MAG: hypothetical protein EZS28_003492 [Streblomastix strix]
METTIEINNENRSEQVEQQIEKRSVGRPKKYFNDEDRKEAIRKQQLATKRRYAQKKTTSLLIITLVETANLFLIANAFDVINGFQIQQGWINRIKQFNETLLLQADKSELIDLFSKTEDDALFLLKADKSETYSKLEDDALLLLKVDKSDIYSKTEDDAILLLKAVKSELIDVYSKTEDDALLLLKANVADLTNYVDLTSAQTITGQKQFGVIGVSSISKQSQNDASILLAGGGDMLVSSLVTQPQLQEVRDIATGKSKAYVFSTQGELNDWMAFQDNVAKLVIGDYLYIVDKEVTDY